MKANDERCLTADQAIAKAKEACAEEGWPCLEPTRAQSGWFSWTVTTNTGCLGCNARIKISKKNGAVISKCFNPR